MLGRRFSSLAAAGLIATGAFVFTGGAGDAAMPDNCRADGQNVRCLYTFTGSEQTFTVPTGVTEVGLMAVGGHGGNTSGAVGLGPAGSGTFGNAIVTGGSSLYIEVGGRGANASDSLGGPGGYNGGGSGGSATPGSLWRWSLWRWRRWRRVRRSHNLPDAACKHREPDHFSGGRRRPRQRRWRRGCRRFDQRRRYRWRVDRPSWNCGQRRRRSELRRCRWWGWRRGHLRRRRWRLRRQWRQRHTVPEPSPDERRQRRNCGDLCVGAIH